MYGPLDLMGDDCQFQLEHSSKSLFLHQTEGNFFGRIVEWLLPDPCLLVHENGRISSFKSMLLSAKNFFYGQVAPLDAVCFFADCRFLVLTESLEWHGMPNCLPLPCV
jgi:hypothetical protein